MLCQSMTKRTPFLASASRATVSVGKAGGSCASTRSGFGDRKSTRLNSSHRCISYAVFCLKKKTYIHRLLLLLADDINQRFPLSENIKNRPTLPLRVTSLLFDL